MSLRDLPELGDDLSILHPIEHEGIEGLPTGIASDEVHGLYSLMMGTIHSMSRYPIAIITPTMRSRSPKRIAIEVFITRPYMA